MQCAVQLKAESCSRGCTVLSVFLLHMCRICLEDDLLDACKPRLPDCWPGNALESTPMCGNPHCWPRLQWSMASSLSLVWSNAAHPALLPL